MKKLLFILGIAALFGCRNESVELTQKEQNIYDSIVKAEKENPAAAVKSFSKDDMIKIVLKEPKVKDAMINDAGTLYAAVWTDGTDRTGYANYLKQLCTDNNYSINRVKIVNFKDITEKKAMNDWEILGDSGL